MATIAENLQILENHLEDAYAAIENKGGIIPNTHNATNLSASIDTIPKREVEALYNDVCFYRPDGFRLYSYTKDEVMSANFVMPELKQWDVVWDTVNGKDTIQMLPLRWNFTLEKIRLDLQQGGFCDVGGVYEPSDHCAHIKLVIDNDNKPQDFRLVFTRSQYVYRIKIQWGDDKTDTVDGGQYWQNHTRTHTYQTPGTYHLKIGNHLDGKEDYALDIGTGSASGTIYGEYAQDINTNPNPTAYANMIRAALLSNTTKLGGYAFYYCRNLEYISYVDQSGYSSISGRNFFNCINLKCLINPLDNSQLGHSCCQNCYGLLVYSNSSTASTGTDINMFYSCDSLYRIFLQKYSDNNIVRLCYALGRLAFGYELTTIGNFVINSEYSLRSIIYPPKLTSIGRYNGHNCYNLILHDFRNAESVPTLGTNCFSNANPNMKIVVPDTLYDTWIAATNWSAVSSKIVKASEYTE